jgi:hypothetical protein
MEKLDVAIQRFSTDNVGLTRVVCSKPGTEKPNEVSFLVEYRAKEAVLWNDVATRIWPEDTVLAIVIQDEKMALYELDSEYELRQLEETEGVEIQTVFMRDKAVIAPFRKEK